MVGRALGDDGLRALDLVPQRLERTIGQTALGVGHVPRLAQAQLEVVYVQQAIDEEAGRVGQDRGNVVSQMVFRTKRPDHHGGRAHRLVADAREHRERAPVGKTVDRL